MRVFKGRDMWVCGLWYSIGYVENGKSRAVKGQILSLVSEVIKKHGK